jgi:hypothetical protein
MCLKIHTYKSKAGGGRHVNSSVRMLTSRPIQRTTLHPYRPDSALCRSAFCPHYKSYQIYRLSLSPRLAPTHPFTSALTHKNPPQFYLALSLPGGPHHTPVHFHSVPTAHYSAKGNSAVAQLRVLHRWKELDKTTQND